MATIGDTSKPTSGWHAFQGQSYPQQEGERLTMPAHGDITDLGAWVGGWSGTVRLYLCLWADDFELLASVGPITVASHGAGGPAGGNVERVEASLATPVRLAAGVEFYVGFDRIMADGHQVSVGGSGTHYEGDRGGTSAPWPSTFGRVGGIAPGAGGRCGAYVAGYAPVAGAKVYDGAAWVDADSVKTYDGAAWVDADAVQVNTGAGWVDSE